jgi:Ca-activated chloride channel family protein
MHDQGKKMSMNDRQILYGSFGLYGALRRTTLPLVALFVFCCVSPLISQPGRGKVKQGNRLYKEQKYDAAKNQYQDALLEDPNSPVVQFNMGDVTYQTKDYQKAMESFHKTLNVKDAAMQSMAYYNVGNSLYRLNKLPESIQAYQEALKLNPDDQDAKYNLEYVRNKLKQNSQPKQQNPQNQQDQKNKQDQKNQDDKKKDDKKQQDQQKQQQEQPQQQEQKKKEMSKEQAEQILKALNEKQKDQKEKQAQAGGEATVEKDW